MQAHKLVLLVLDFEGYGPEQIEMMASNARGLDPSVMSIETRDIGEWTDDHPLNKQGTAEAEFDRLFAPVSTPQQSAQRASVEEGEVEYELYEVSGDDVLMVAGTSGKRAYEEILHYAAQYAQDGPVEIHKLVRTKLSIPVAAPSPAPQGEQA